MTPMSLGRVNVAAAGTPVRLTADASIRARRLSLTVIAGLTGKMYLGVANMNKDSLAGVIREFWPNPTGGISDKEVIEAPPGSSLTVADYWLDAAVNGEGMIVAYWV